MKEQYCEICLNYIKPSTGIIGTCCLDNEPTYPSWGNSCIGYKYRDKGVTGDD